MVGLTATQVVLILFVLKSGLYVFCERELFSVTHWLNNYSGYKVPNKFVACPCIWNYILSFSTLFVCN